MLPNYPEPLVVQVLREHKIQILAQEENSMREMAERWMRMEAALESDMIAAATEIDLLRQAGKVVDVALLHRYDRYARLVYQSHAELRTFIQFASGSIGQSQERLAGLGIDHAAEAIRSVYSQAGVIGARFDILPRDALQTLIGYAADGTPLDQYLRRIYGDATDGLTQALIDGLAKGLNPVEVARQMRDGFGMGLNHALNTARTESLRAYRAASLEQYRSSGVVSGWKRLAAHDERTCAGCLFSEGEFYPNEDAFQEHNQGRCTMVPVVEGVDEPTWVSGQDWFLQQPEEAQVSILGQARFEAWKGGSSLDKMVTRVYDPVWGASFIPTPVGALP
jgi:SPP1 gp7 family putative phage head morphogenesis protein